MTLPLCEISGAAWPGEIESSSALHSRNVCAHRVLLIIFHKGIGVKLVSRTPPCYQGGRNFSDIFVIHKV